MKRTTRLFVLVGAVVPLLVRAASNDSAGQTNTHPAMPMVNSPGVIISPLVAKGRHVSVSRNDLDEELIRIKATLAGQGRSLPGDSATIERQILDSLVSRQLLLDKATEADRIKGREQFEASLQKFKTNARLTDEEFNQKLTQQLRLQDQTKRQWEQQGIEQATLPIVLERELKIAATDDQARKFYDENHAKFEQPEMVRAAHILLLTSDPVTKKELSEEQKAAKKKQMEGLLKQARAGEDFAKLAKDYSEDPGSKDRGGEYTFPRGQMMAEFKAAAFSLNTNQVSDIVTTAYGYHIIKLYEKIPAKMVQFDKVASDIKEYLMQRELQKKAPEYLQKLQKEAGVEILDARLKSVEVPNPGAPPEADSEPQAAKK